MTKTDNFRGKFDEILVFPKYMYVCVLRNCTLIYHVAMCVMGRSESFSLACVVINQHYISLFYFRISNCSA